LTLDEYGEPVFEEALRDAERVGAGPWVDALGPAIGAGFVDLASSDGMQVLAHVDQGRRSYALAALVESGPGPDGVELYAIWIATLENRVRPVDEADGDSEADVEPEAPAPDAPPDPALAVEPEPVPLEYRRIGARRIYEHAMRSEPQIGEAADRCSVETELRARDIDGDGEIELTAIVAFVTPTRMQWGGGGQPEECGAVAFIAGADLAIQAAFTREYRFVGYAASSETRAGTQATWRVRDVNGDGHADLHVTESWNFHDYFMGDYIGDGETMDAQRTRDSDRREVDCPWIEAEDVWRCPDPAPGRTLLGDPASRNLQRPW
jgi:hypothetical protein